MRFISEDIEKYCKDYSVKDTDLLKELSKTTWEIEEIPQMLSGSLVGGLLQILGCGIALAIALVLCGHWRERRWGTPPRAAHSLQQSLLGEGGRPRARRGSSPACMSSWQEELQQARRV